ncbi:MAG TPA: four helix bundle protein, partial [Saprospiraceae bacterium]|nr:four helix bundle protein [Saprospiraceae bacterium]
MKNYTSYKDLQVWKTSMKLIQDVYQISASFPDSEKFGITSQIRRASISIANNIAEGKG